MKKLQNITLLLQGKIPTITTIFKISRVLNNNPTELFEKQDIDRQAIKNQVISLIQSKL